MTVTVTLWTQGETDVGGGGRHLETVSKLSGAQKRLGVNRPCPPTQTPEKGMGGDPRGCCVRSRSGPSPGVMSRGQSLCRAPSGALVL